MREIREMRSGAIALYPADLVSFHRVLVKTGEKIKSKFGFHLVGLKDDGGIEFNNGLMKVADDEIVIRSTTINVRRVALTIEGTSAQADAILARLVLLLLEGAEAPKPLVVASESVLTAEMDFDWSDIYSPAFLGFLETVRSLSSTGDVEPRVAGATTQIRLRYLTPQRFDEHAISISPKNFSIEPHPSLPLHDRRYVISAPTRSENLVKLAEGLEAAIVSARKEDQ